PPAVHLRPIDLRDLQGEGVLFGEVPGVAGELSLHAVGDAGGTEEPERALTGEEQPQELVEAHEVGHVRVRAEVRLDGKERGPGRAIDAAQVDQQGTPLPAQRDEQRGVSCLSVQQARAKRGLGHRDILGRRLRARQPGGTSWYWTVVMAPRYT